ncbi:uncharacterized protein ASPGLDRAFT_54808, partial [Aspergillus glaucus CBS 516.65]
MPPTFFVSLVASAQAPAININSPSSLPEFFPPTPTSYLPVLAADTVMSPSDNDGGLNNCLHSFFPPPSHLLVLLAPSSLYHFLLDLVLLSCSCQGPAGKP